MGNTTTSRRLQKKRKERVKKQVQKNKEKLRLSVFKSDRHIYGQIIDDTQGKTLVSESTLTNAFKATGKKPGNIAAAKWVGSSLGKKASKNGIQIVYYDRGGFRYHGRIKALADSVREAGLKF